MPDVDEIDQLDNESDRTTAEIHAYGQDPLGRDRRRRDLVALGYRLASGMYSRGPGPV